jgi:antitoxin MazE
MMKWTVSKWGNSLALRIPQAVAEQLGIREGSELDVTASEREIVARKPRYTLEELLDGITDENRHEEMDWGPPAGREEW